MDAQPKFKTYPRELGKCLDPACNGVRRRQPVQHSNRTMGAECNVCFAVTPLGFGDLAAIVRRHDPAQPTASLKNGRSG